MIFRHYRFDTIREKADQFRNEYWGNKIPVDIENIIEFRLGLEVRPVKALRSSRDIEGMLSNDLTTVLVDNQLFSETRFESRLRFTLAHEMGHFVLHRDFYESVKFHNPDGWLDVLHDLDPVDLDWYEKHANEFAGRLLVPYDPLLAEVSKLKSEIQELVGKAEKAGLGDEIESWVASALAAKVCQKFYVSSKTLEIRLRREGIELV